MWISDCRLRIVVSAVCLRVCVCGNVVRLVFVAIVFAVIVLVLVIVLAVVLHIVVFVGGSTSCRGGGRLQCCGLDGLRGPVDFDDC